MSCSWWELYWILLSSITCSAYCLSFFPTRGRFSKQQAMYCWFSDQYSEWLRCFHLSQINVVFPSFGWSTCTYLSPCRDDESWIPLGNFTGPSFLALCSNSERLAPLQFFCVYTQFVRLYASTFRQLLSSFFICIRSTLPPSSSSNEMLLSWSYSSCVFYLSILTYVVVANVFFS